MISFTKEYLIAIDMLEALSKEKSLDFNELLEKMNTSEAFLKKVLQKLKNKGIIGNDNKKIKRIGQPMTAYDIYLIFKNPTIGTNKSGVLLSIICTELKKFKV